MTKWQLDRDGGPWDYPTLGFSAVDGAIIDGSLSNPVLTTAPDAFWTEYVGASTETGVTRWGELVHPPAPAEPTEGSMLLYDATANRFAPSTAAEVFANSEVEAALSATIETETAPAFIRRFAAPLAAGADNAAAILAELNTYGRATLRKGETYPVTSLAIPAGAILDLNGATITKHSGTSNLLTPGAGAKVFGGTIDLNGLAGAAVRIAAADVEVSSLTVQDGALSSAIDCNAATRPVITDVSSDGCKFGVLLNGGTSDATVRGGTHRNGTSTETYSGSLYIPNAVRAHISGVRVIDAAGHGAWIGGATSSDILLEGCEFRSCGTSGDTRGVTVDSSIARVRFIGCSFIDNYEAGAYVSGTPTEVEFHGCTARGNNTGLRPGGHGFEHLGLRGKIIGCRSTGNLGDAANEGCGFYVGTNGTAVLNCDARSNYSAGIRAVDSNKTLIQGNRCSNNSQRGVGFHDGIQVTTLSAGASKGVQVIGNQCWDDQATKTQRYGIDLTVNTDLYVIANNVALTANHVTGGINDAGGAVSKSVVNNLTA